MKIAEASVQINTCPAAGHAFSPKQDTKETIVCWNRHKKTGRWKIEFGAKLRISNKTEESDNTQKDGKS